MSEPTRPTGQPEHAPLDRRAVDGGLRGMGLLMQLTGITGASVAIYVLFLLAIAPRVAFPKWVALLVAVTAGARSVVHFVAGRRASAGDPGGLARYVWVAVAQTAVAIAALVVGAGLPVRVAAGAALLLLAWPAVVFVFQRREVIARLSDAPAEPPDRGLDGLALLMIVLGVVGVCVGAISALPLFTGSRMGGMVRVLGTLLVLLFLARSALHLQAGLNLSRRGDFLRFAIERERYFMISTVSSALLAVLVVISAMFSNILIVVLTLPLLGVLMAWPVIVRRFGGMPLSEWAEVESRPPTRAPDGGLSAIAVMLLGFGAFALASLAAMAIAGGGLGPVGFLTGAGAKSGTLAVLLGIAGAGVMLWTGRELLQMSDRVQVATAALLVVALVQVGFATWQWWDTAGPILTAQRFKIASRAQIIAPLVAQTLVPLTLPLVAFIRARRLPSREALGRLEDIF